MEDDANQSPSNMVPVALAVLGIVLGGAGLYFGLTANQRLNPIDESVSAGATSSAKIEKVINGFQTQVAELAAQISEQSKTVNRLRIYSSQGEQAVKKLAGELNTNRAQIVKTAEMLNEFAAVGFRAVPAPQGASAASNDTGSPAAIVAPGAASTYVIVSGDNFGKIAGKFGVAVQAILDANPDADPRRLAIGQTIQIPTK
ncbi:LysM peptidoglycan-binding domain-containing protein [Puniceicoccaceae bacterium]|jgi:LysM repeat protein|nr:LysM peptidoglycan-binding domain-containing protein [Puniceicoccaceae bacterium]